LRNAEDTLLRVELDVLLLKALERDIEVINLVTDPLGFDHNVINVGLDGWADVFPQNVLHESLVRRPRVLETEGHSNIAIHVERGDKRSHELIGLLHFNLVVARICI
jgi:hypothetical protein